MKKIFAVVSDLIAVLLLVAMVPVAIIAVGLPIVLLIRLCIEIGGWL